MPWRERSCGASSGRREDASRDTAEVVRSSVAVGWQPVDDLRLMLFQERLLAAEESG